MPGPDRDRTRRNVSASADLPSEEVVAWLRVVILCSERQRHRGIIGSGMSRSLVVLFLTFSDVMGYGSQCLGDFWYCFDGGEGGYGGRIMV